MKFRTSSESSTIHTLQALVKTHNDLVRYYRSLDTKMSMVLQYRTVIEELVRTNDSISSTLESMQHRQQQLERAMISGGSVRTCVCANEKSALRTFWTFFKESAMRGCDGCMRALDAVSCARACLAKTLFDFVRCFKIWSN